MRDKRQKKRLTKKALLLLRLPEKYSFTFSKLRFFGLRKPKNSSFYPTSLQTWVTHFTFGSPTSNTGGNLFATADNLPDSGSKKSAGKRSHDEYPQLLKRSTTLEQSRTDRACRVNRSTCVTDTN